MKVKYIKELILLLIQLFMFYIYPIFIGPIDPIAMVLIILFVTLILSLLLVFISNEKIKYFYPIIISILFIPSVFIYYNESALVHAIWYLIFSSLGVMLGLILKKIITSFK